MSNRFCDWLDNNGRCIELNNARTDVFLGVLQFALTDLARNQWERRLAQWVAWHDQDYCGRGLVGFDLIDIGWSADAFEERRAHLADTVYCAELGHCRACAP